MGSLTFAVEHNTKSQIKVNCNVFLPQRFCLFPISFPVHLTVPQLSTCCDEYTLQHMQNLKHYVRAYVCVIPNSVKPFSQRVLKDAVHSSFLKYNIPWPPVSVSCQLRLFLISHLSPLPHISFISSLFSHSFPLTPFH
jgi:hypothetical protein